MQITVTCPHCEERFHVDADLRGKRMRCPQPLCRAIFEVPRETEKPPPTAPSAGVITGSVTDLIPLLPADFAEPVKAREPVAKKAPRPASQEPVVRKPSVTPAPAPEAPSDFPDDFPGDDDVLGGDPAVVEGPQEIGPGTWEAPPIRGMAEEPAPVTTMVASPPAEPVRVEAPAAGHGARRRAMLVFGVIAVLGIGAGTVGWQMVENVRAGSEADRFKQVQELYDKHEFAEANVALNKLMKDFPDSRDTRKYRLLAELISVRGDAEDAHGVAELRPALDRVLQFLSINQQEPPLKQYHADVWSTLEQVAKQLANEADAQHDADALKWARQAAAEADKFEPPADVDAKARKRDLEARFGRIATALTAHAQRQAVIAAVKQRIEHATAAGVKEARALVAAAGLQGDTELAGLLNDLVAAHRAAVKYEPAGATTQSVAIDDDALPGLLPMPFLKRGKNGRAPGGVALAMARGVLYAFEPAHGDFRWSRRVGIDTSVLPLRVPADPITPELVLVLSSDSRSVTALVAETGAVVWQHTLPQPCTGQPVLVGRSLLVPTIAGRIDEVEISEGRLLGHYDLRQRLSVGGAQQPGTSLVYFPGDDFCIYVLDANRRTCEAVLYSNHPAGSLRGVPILVRGRPLAKDAEPIKGLSGWMLLCQAKGNDAVEVRPFELPIRDPDQAPAAPIHIPGLSWFPPYHDAEKLAVATDAGLLSLWGIQKKGNRGDPLLFRLLNHDYAAGGGPGRAQVVHADVDSYWMLSGGRLHRLNNVFRPDSGPDLIAAWPQPPLLGSPLHPAQHHRDTAGRSHLLLATLALDRPICMCTAVNAASGRFAWQRQLGCIPVHPPVAVDGRVLLRDATGLLLLDPAEFAGAKTWQPLDSLLDDADHPDTLGPDDRVMVLPAAREFVQLTWSSTAAAPTLRVRHVPLTGPATAELHNLPAPPAGTAALGDGFVILPLGNGVAMRVDFNGTLVAGPNWRAPGADEQSPGHVVALGGDDFLLTDGGRGVMRVSWPGKLFQQRAVAELGARIVTPPAVLPTAAGTTPRICVADASDTLTLLDGERLDKLRSWPLPGKITAGPFVRGSAIVCVLDHRRLILLHPEEGEPREYAMIADIVGAPVLVEGMLVVADVSGHFLALNPRTGAALGAGYTMRANTAPETTPVPFGPGRLLVPLNDGTLLLLPLDKLR